jgi:hypothetical protein
VPPTPATQFYTPRPAGDAWTPTPQRPPAPPAGAPAGTPPFSFSPAAAAPAAPSMVATAVSVTSPLASPAGAAGGPPPDPETIAALFSGVLRYQTLAAAEAASLGALKGRVRDLQAALADAAQARSRPLLFLTCSLLRRCRRRIRPPFIRRRSAPLRSPLPLPAHGQPAGAPSVRDDSQPPGPQELEERAEAEAALRERVAHLARRLDAEMGLRDGDVAEATRLLQARALRRRSLRHFCCC